MLLVYGWPFHEMINLVIWPRHIYSSIQKNLIFAPFNIVSRRFNFSNGLSYSRIGSQIQFDDRPISHLKTCFFFLLLKNWCVQLQTSRKVLNFSKKFMEEQLLRISLSITSFILTKIYTPRKG